MKAVDTIEGIGDSYAQALKGAKIATTEDLLEQAGSKAGRKALAETLNVSEKLLLKWVNMADLFRIKGVAGQYAELLELAGVDTVPELAQRNAESLHTKMREANDARRVVRQPPSLSAVEGWIREAKSLPRKVSH